MLLLVAFFISELLDYGFEFDSFIAAIFGLLWFASNVVFNKRVRNVKRKNSELEYDLIDSDLFQEERAIKFKGQKVVGVILIALSFVLLFGNYTFYESIGTDIEYTEIEGYVFLVLLVFLAYLGIATPVFVIWTWVKFKRR